MHGSSCGIDAIVEFRGVVAPDGTTLATPLRRANVAVVLNASDHDHFAISGEAPFRSACPSWASLTFLADHDIADQLGALLKSGGVDTVVFASNALITAAAQQAIADNQFIALWAEDGPGRDIGVVVLHQFLRPGSALGLDFLGSATFSLLGEPPRSVDSAAIRFPRHWLFTNETPYKERVRRFLALAEGYGSQRSSVWASSKPKYPDEWEPIVWEEEGRPLITGCNSGQRLVIDSRIPIDLMGNTELLGSLIASCLRSRGCLLVEAPRTSGSTAFTPALASAIERGRFVHRIRADERSEIDPARAPYHFFDELIIAPEWHFDQIDALDVPVVLRKLEQGGSLVATFTGPRDSPITVRLAGRPQYAERAIRLASWFPPRLNSFKDDLWSIRGLAEAVAATRDAYEDKRLIPPALREDYVRRHLADSLVARIGDGNVDDNVLVTAATYAALAALRVLGHEGLLAWVDAHLDVQLSSVVAQVLILVPALRTPERLERVNKAVSFGGGADDDARLLRAYAAVLFAESEPELVRTAAADPSLGLGVQAELLRVMARNHIQATDEIVGLAALVREHVDRLVEGRGGLEAVCLGNASLIELARRQGVGPTVSVWTGPREAEALMVENTELVQQRESAVRDAARYQRVGRRATTVLVAVLILLTAAIVAAIFIWSGGALGDKFGFASGVFALMSGFIGWVVAKARSAGLPPWPSS